jgi:hypothetical protein
MYGIGRKFGNNDKETSNMSKHTPGPWFIPSTAGSSGGVAHASGYVCFTAIPRKVDEARQPGESWLDMRNRTQQDRDATAVEESANARLIAAAPELLEALIDARKQLQDYEEALNGEDYNSPSINAAIAKATGLP